VIRREPFGRPGVIAAARLANAIFFLGVAVYSLLSYSPFAYRQFIEPNVLPAVADFVAVSPWIFWVMLLLTLLTLVPQLRAAAGRRRAMAYLIVWGGIGVGFAIARPLDAIGNSWGGLAVGLLALVSPVWLAMLDHAVQPAPKIGAIDRGRALAACLWSAAAVWAMYAVAVPYRLEHAVGVALPPSALGGAVAAALVLDLFVFMAIFLAIASAGAITAAAADPGRYAYWVLLALLAFSAAWVFYALVGASIAFASWDAALASAAVGVALAATWADLARLRIQDASPRTLDALDVFSAPVAGGGSRVAAAAILVSMPLVSLVLVDAVSHFDWNFLLQKLGVLLVWLATFAAVHAATRPRALRSPALAMAMPLLVLALYHAVIPTVPDTVLDRYAAVDPSLRVIRDARTRRSAETAEYYAFLRANTLVSHTRIPPVAVDFVKPLPAAAARPPDVFVFVIDSLRRDYLSPYNNRVTFTPEIAKLAAGSFVFERAFTRYAGTMLALPSIWAGGMVPHTLEQPAFGGRNALLKLLDANGYVRAMTRDDAVSDVMTPSSSVVELAKGKGSMDVDVCTTVTELESLVSAPGRTRPIFFHSLPQNVHIAIASRRQVPDGESYPGFFAPVASSVRQIDACLGGFIAFLKRTGLYDDSIVILISDHGDSLGEEGRWGHAYFVVPEVMRIPMIVHLPKRMQSHVSAELGAVAFSADLAPSLYALLGYDLADLGPLFGKPLFVAPDADVEWRRREPFLVASSYGAVYGTVRDNGRTLFVVDAVDGRESAFDMTASPGTRREVTADMAESNRRIIRRQLDLLASQFAYREQ
jgi:hypothetical protein